MSFFNPTKEIDEILERATTRIDELNAELHDLQRETAKLAAQVASAEEMRDFYKEHYEELKKERAVPADQNNWAKVQEKVTQLEAVEDADTTVLEAQEGFLDRFNEIHGGGLSVEDMLERRAAFDAEHKQEAE